MSKLLRALILHESIIISDPEDQSKETTVTRVPGGYIYSTKHYRWQRRGLCSPWRRYLHSTDSVFVPELKYE